LEVVSDPTNALALEVADRRLRDPAAGSVYLAASHRVLRTQAFPPGMASHFRLSTHVSSARDAGSGLTEARLPTVHLRYRRDVLAPLRAEAAPRLRFTVLDRPVLRERLAATVLPAPGRDDQPNPVVGVEEEPDRDRGRGYYAGVAMRLTARDGDSEVEPVTAGSRRGRPS
jgi:hypothetical protein